MVANSFAPPLIDSPFNVNSTRIDVWEAILNSTTTNPVHAVENGNTADGSPGILTQAEILTAIAPTLSARGDTFTIRAYGQAEKMISVPNTRRNSPNSSTASTRSSRQGARIEPSSS